MVKIRRAMFVRKYNEDYFSLSTNICSISYVCAVKEEKKVRIHSVGHNSHFCNF